MMATPIKHIEVGRCFLAHADEFLEASDLPQASEKGWGAVAHYLKAVAKQRGWRNRSYRDLFIIKERLTQETRDPERITELFGVLNGLHQNFYEPLYSIADVKVGIDAVKEFIDRLERAGTLER